VISNGMGGRRGHHSRSVAVGHRWDHETGGKREREREAMRSQRDQPPLDFLPSPSGPASMRCSLAKECPRDEPQSVMRPVMRGTISVMGGTISVMRGGDGSLI